MRDEDSLSVMSPRASCNRAEYGIPIRPRAQLAQNERRTGKGACQSSPVYTWWQRGALGTQKNSICIIGAVRMHPSVSILLK